MRASSCFQTIVFGKLSTIVFKTRKQTAFNKDIGEGP
jgi:hypothetical protein